MNDVCLSGFIFLYDARKLHHSKRRSGSPACGPMSDVCLNVTGRAAGLWKVTKHGEDVAATAAAVAAASDDDDDDDDDNEDVWWRQRSLSSTSAKQ